QPGSRRDRRRRGRGTGGSGGLRGKAGTAVTTERTPGTPPQPPRRLVVGTEPTGPVRASAYVCEAVSCLSAQSHDILTGLAEQVATDGTTDVAIKRVGCLGLCAAG